MNPFQHLDWADLINHLERLATCEVSREAIRDMGVLPNEEMALKSFQEIEESQKILAVGRRPTMESLDLYSTWYERLKREAVLKPLELKDVRHFCIEVLDLKDSLSAMTSRWPRQMFEDLMEARGPLSAIDQVMTASGDIRNDASETLFLLFKEKQDKERHLHGSLDRIVKKNEMTSILQDRYVTNRQGRWVVPVKSGMQHDLEGIIHDQSHSKQTVFIEPQEVVAFNNQLAHIEGEIEEEIERLLTELSRYLQKHVLEFENSKKVLQHMDVRMAQGQLAQQVHARPCRFNSERIYLLNVRHPLLILQNDRVIPNHVELSTNPQSEKQPAKHILLLSGPNAGGKTVLLKSVGLAAHMARCGLLICADEGSELPFFEGISVAAGDDQSVYKNLSTFAAHLKALTQASERKGPQHLLLVDEICSSTDPEEGAALARSFIEHFDKNKVFGIVTSHFGTLKEGWSKESGVIYGRLEYDELAGRPTYRLYLGLPGQSLALKTAQSIGVPKEILDRALNFLHPETQARHRKLDELESLKGETLELRERLRVEEKQAKDMKQKYLELVTHFKKEKETWLARAIEKGEKRIDELIEKAKQSAENLKATLDFKAQLPLIIKTAEKTSIQSAEDFARAYPPGSVVYVTQLQQEGIVQSAPDSKGRVTILSQSMRLQLGWQELSPPTSALKRSIGQSVSKFDGGRSGAATSGLGARYERSMDLRGQRVEEALREIESQLDIAIRNGEDRLKIVHGHGTEALKKAVRTYLSRSPYVRKWKAGDGQAGGDGVTWVELAD